MSINPTDYESLRRIAGFEAIPKAVEKEYELRCRMFHRDGQSGPLGTAMLVDMLRALDYVAPKTATAEAGGIEWGSFPTDGSIRVQARYFGDWQPGVFVRMESEGMLGIRLDDDEMVRECRRDIVRLVTNQADPTDEVNMNKQARSEEPSAGAKLIEEQAEQAERDAKAIPDEPIIISVAKIVGDVPSKEKPKGKGKQSKAVSLPESEAKADSDPEVRPVSVPVDQERPAISGDVNWAEIPVNTALWVQTDGDVADAKFLSYEANQVEALLEGEDAPQKFPANSVVIAA